MNYQDSLNFLYSCLPMYQRTGAAAYKNDLSNTLEFDKYHNHPHRSFFSVHIAGTNGKGSVSHMLASILQAAGYKTGLYTSPHLKDFRERIKINGKKIPEQEVINYLSENKKIIEKIQPSFFEMTVDLAFIYFEKMKIDIAIIETGMGGRLDSTNIIQPLVSVITNIGLDHTRFLGNSLAQIAKEKAGIIKEKTPVVIGEYLPETLPVFITEAKSAGSDIFLSQDHYKAEYSQMSLKRTQMIKVSDLITQKDIVLETDLLGKYQQKNILTVLQTLEILKRRKITIKDDIVLNGLKSVIKTTGLRGRWEEIGFNPLIICDTAHNAEGIRLVMEQLNNTACKNLHIIWGMVSDKNPHKILQLLPKNARYYFTKADIPRSAHETILLDMATELGLKGEAYHSPAEAFTAAKNNALPEDVIFIGGSTFLVGELI